MLRLFKITLLSFVCCSLLTMTAYAEQDDVKLRSLQRQKFEKEYKKYAEEKNQTILLYGQIVDFEKNPISNAKLSFSIRFYPESPYAHDFRHKEILSDKDGRFVFEDYGELLTLVGVKKRGYQYRLEYNSRRSFNFARNLKRKGPGFESDKPMIFKMRKKAPPSFVLIGNWEFGLRAGDAKLLDMYRREWAAPDRMAGKKLNYPDWQADIKTSVEETGEGFRLIVEALENDSGFVVESPEFFEEMTEAPAQGYRPKLVIPIAKDSAGQLFAYVKNEGGLFYSKIYINYVNRADRDHVEMRCGYWTNVTGERGLEFVHELASQYRRDAKAKRRSRVKREQLTSGGVEIPVLGVEQ